MRKTQRLLALLLVLALLVSCFGAALAEDGDGGGGDASAPDPAEVAYFYEHGNAIYYRVKRQDDEGRDKDGLDESAYHFYLDLMGNEQYKYYKDEDAPIETLPLYENSIADYWASVAEYINLSTELGNITNFGPILSVLYHATTDYQKTAGDQKYDNEVYIGFSTRPIYAGSMNAARDELIKQFNIKWPGRKLQDLSGAFSYDVFFGNCDGDSDLPAVRSVRKTSCTIRKLKKGATYKAYVQAWRKKGSKKIYIGDISPTAHCIVGGYSKNFTNAKSVKLNKSKLTLAVGKKATLKATVKGVKSGRKLLNHESAVRYFSSNANVAKVNSKGRVTAVSEGSCTIFAIANDGVRASVKVKVKAK